MARTLYVIDGYAQIFRAYYAIRSPMTSPVTGEPTQAVFGFTGMLIKLLSEFKPDYAVVALDAPGKTFRDELFPDYKATRPETPPDLVAQIPRVLELIERFGIPTVQVPGLEADDVIASIVHRVVTDPGLGDVHVRIVSKDKDLEQLLGERVALVDVHTGTVVDVEALRATKGIRPDQVVDVLALVGDPVDNVPGVPGVGMKTAAQWVRAYGSIEGIFAHVDHIRGKRREALEAARDTLPLARALVTLRRDPSIPFSLEAARVRPPRPERLLPLFDQLGFNRYRADIERLAGREAAGDAGNGAATARAGAVRAAPEGSYRIIRTRDELQAVVEELRRAPLVAVDTETTGLDARARLCGISLAWRPGHGVYIPVRSPEPSAHLDEATVLDMLRPVLEDPGIPKAGHNVKFDASVLRRAGAVLRGVVFDSMLASMLLDPHAPGHRLDDLARRLLQYEMIPISTLIGEEGVPMDTVPLERAGPYAAEDADVTLRLYDALMPRLEAAGMAALLRDVEAPLATVLAAMETWGIRCDPEELERQGEMLRERAEALREEILTIAGCSFNLDSPRQLADVLFGRLGLKPRKRTKTGYSTDAEVLAILAEEEDPADPRTAVPRLLLDYRQLTKLIGTYIGSLQEAIDPVTGRIHTTFHQLVTATGRLASHNPNLQNIPVRTDLGRQIRKAFVAPPGHVLICADYSQIELRLLAHLSQDPGLIEAFNRDEDIHAAVASRVFRVPMDQVTREQRTHAKTINFGIIYGVTPYGLSRRIPGLDVAAAARLIDDYKERFPGIGAFMRRCIDQALEHGYVTTLLGRRRAIPEIRASSRRQRSLGERLAINSVVQGSAADLIKVAMVNIQRRIDDDGLPLKLLLQIHDELVFEAPAEEAEALSELVCREMEGALALRVPLKAEAGAGPDWMSAK